MYLKFFGLSEAPFNMTPDPKFIFFSENHKEAFTHLLFGIEQRKGFLEITGEIGAGKTTLCRALLNQLDQTTKTALILNPALSELELLKAINTDFGLAASSESKVELVETLNTFLLQQLSNGVNVVLIIDEAQNLTVPVLEQIRMLSNLETTKEKLLQIVLVGQPELHQKLLRPELKQLFQRISVRFHLAPLSAPETEQYIKHRLKVADNKEEIEFTRRALSLIFKFSTGIPRLINVICDKCLLAAYVEETRTISDVLVKKAIAEIQGKDIYSRGRTQILWKKYRTQPAALISGGVLFLIIIGTILLMNRAETSPPAPELVVSTPIVEQKEKIVVPPETEPKPVVSQDTDPLPFKEIQFKTAAKASQAHFICFYDLTKLWNLEDKLAEEDPAQNSDSPFSFWAYGQKIGLEAVYFNTNLQQLKNFNLPCILDLSPRPSKSGEELFALLAGLSDQEALIVDPLIGKMTYSYNKLEKIWSGRAVVFYQNSDQYPATLRQGTKGEIVLKLKERFQKFGYLKQSELTDQFDEELSQITKHFQTIHNLAIDAIVGPETQIMLYRVTEGKEWPRLYFPNADFELQ